MCSVFLAQEYAILNLCISRIIRKMLKKRKNPWVEHAPLPWIDIYWNKATANNPLICSACLVEFSLYIKERKNLPKTWTAKLFASIKLGVILAVIYCEWGLEKWTPCFHSRLPSLYSQSQVKRITYVIWEDENEPFHYPVLSNYQWKGLSDVW